MPTLALLQDTISLSLDWPEDHPSGTGLARLPGHLRPDSWPLTLEGLGSGKENQLQGKDSACGFPEVFVGTSTVLEVRLKQVQGHLILNAVTFEHSFPLEPFLCGKSVVNHIDFNLVSERLPRRPEVKHLKVPWYGSQGKQNKI